MWALSWSLVWQVPTVWEVTYPTGHQARWRPLALGCGFRFTATNGGVQALASRWGAGCVGLGQLEAAGTRSMTRPRTLGRNLALRWLVSLGSGVQWALGGSEYPLCADHHSERTKAHRMPPIPCLANIHIHRGASIKWWGYNHLKQCHIKIKVGNQKAWLQSLSTQHGRTTCEFQMVLGHLQPQVWARGRHGSPLLDSFPPVRVICIPPDLENTSPLCRRKWVGKMTWPCSSKT